MLFIIPCSLGNPAWWMEGNSDNDIAGAGLGFTLWGSSINNPYSDINYSKCTIGGSLFNPIADDYDYDGFREIVTTGSNKLNIYDMDCNLEYVVNIGLTTNESLTENVSLSYLFFEVDNGNPTDRTSDVTSEDGTFETIPLQFVSNNDYALINISPETFTTNTTLILNLSAHDNDDTNKTIYIHNLDGSFYYGNFTTPLVQDVFERYEIPLNAVAGNTFLYISGNDSTKVEVDFEYIQVNVTRPVTLEPTGIKAMPVSMNSLENGVSEIYVLTNETLNVYQFSNASDDFIEVYSFDYYEEFGDSNLDYLTCVNDYLRVPYCHAFKTGTLHVWSFNMETLEMDYKPTELTYGIESTTGEIGDGIANGRLQPIQIDDLWDYLEVGFAVVNPILYLGVRSSSHFLGEVLHINLFETSDEDQQFRVPVCHAIATAGNNRMYCNMLDADGYNLASPIVSDQSVGTGNTLSEISSGIAKHGSQMRLFVRYDTTNNFYRIAEIFDSDGNELYQKVLNSANDRLSNWMVVDFNKDGYNDACIFIKESGETFLKCMHDDFTTLVNINTTTTFNDPSLDMIMADFVPTNDYMCFADRNGIFCPNSTGVTQVYNTLLPIINGTGMTVYSDGFYSPAYIFSSQTSGTIIKNPLASAICGNDICDASENFYNCPADCNISSIDDLVEEGEFPEGYPCETDTDCEYGLECEYGECALSTAGEDCDENDDCISGECLNSKCTKAGLWARIDASSTQINGDDDDTHTFLALTILFVIGGVIAVAGRNMWSAFAGIIVIFIGSIFFAFVGWLSPFIILGEVIIALLGVVLFFVARGSD